MTGIGFPGWTSSVYLVHLGAGYCGRKLTDFPSPISSVSMTTFRNRVVVCGGRELVQGNPLRQECYEYHEDASNVDGTWVPLPPLPRGS